MIPLYRFRRLKIAQQFIIAVCVSAVALAQDPWKQPNGLVPDKETAIKVAEAILFSIYGEEQIKKERPYRVELTDGMWDIRGSMPKSEYPINGGTFFITILQADGRVLDIGHFL